MVEGRGCIGRFCIGIDIRGWRDGGGSAATDMPVWRGVVLGLMRYMTTTQRMMMLMMMMTKWTMEESKSLAG